VPTVVECGSPLPLVGSQLAAARFFLSSRFFSPMSRDQVTTASLDDKDAPAQPR